MPLPLFLHLAVISRRGSWTREIASLCCALFLLTMFFLTIWFYLQVLPEMCQRGFILVPMFGSRFSHYLDLVQSWFNLSLVLGLKQMSHGFSYWLLGLVLVQTQVQCLVQSWFQSLLNFGLVLVKLQFSHEISPGTSFVLDFVQSSQVLDQFRF